LPGNKACEAADGGFGFTQRQDEFREGLILFFRSPWITTI